MMRVGGQRSLVDLISLLVGAMLLVALFSACLMLLQLRERAGSSFGPGTPATAIFLLGRPVSREALTMCCILLAGLAGGYLQYMRERFNELAAEGSGSLSAESRGEKANSIDTIRPWIAFFSQLLMGVGAASVAGLFIPLAIADPPGLSIYNPWGLLIVGVTSGYMSRKVFGGLQAKMERLLGELHRSGRLASDPAQFSSAVKEGVLEALGAPTPINFSGTVSLDVVDMEGITVVGHRERSPQALLQLGKSYRALAIFQPNDGGRAGESPHVQRIAIDNGVDAARVPFDLRLELSFLTDLAPMELAADVASKGGQTVHEFRFTLPAEKPMVDRESLEIALFVYQKSLFCTAAILPVGWGFAL